MISKWTRFSMCYEFELNMCTWLFLTMNGWTPHPYREGTGAVLSLGVFWGGWTIYSGPLWHMQIHREMYVVRSILVYCAVAEGKHLNQSSSFRTLTDTGPLLLSLSSAFGYDAATVTVSWNRWFQSTELPYDRRLYTVATIKPFSHRALQWRARTASHESSPPCE